MLPLEGNQPSIGAVLERLQTLLFATNDGSDTLDLPARYIIHIEILAAPTDKDLVSVGRKRCTGDGEVLEMGGMHFAVGGTINLPIQSHHETQ